MLEIKFVDDPLTKIDQIMLAMTVKYKMLFIANV